MYKFFIFSFLCLFNFNFLSSHEGHRDRAKNQVMAESMRVEDQATVKEFGGRPLTWLKWIGGFHLIFLHFPIALIAMTMIAEVLYAWSKRPIFDNSSRFMLISAAILAVPTALLGLAYRYTATYSGLLADFVWWHMWAGIITALFAIIVAFIRERYGIGKLYYCCLVFLFALINVTGFLGAGMTFGPYHMNPPI